MPVPIFNMKIDNLQDALHVLNKKSGIFEEVNDITFIHAHAVNGVFRIDKGQIEFEATSFKKFKMVVAYFSEGVFQMKYEVTMQNGDVECKTLQKIFENNDGVYSITSEFGLDTVLIVGIVAAAEHSIVNFKIHGNDIDNKQICWNKSSDQVNDILEAQTLEPEIMDTFEAEKPEPDDVTDHTLKAQSDETEEVDEFNNFQFWQSQVI